MGEESNLEKRLVFAGLTDRPEFTLIPVTLQETLEWKHDVSETIGRVMNLSETNETLTFDVDCINQKVVRRILGIPEKPLSKLKCRRKTFKKALMAYGYSRNKAEKICREVVLWGFTFGYRRACEEIIIFRGR